MFGDALKAVAELLQETNDGWGDKHPDAHIHLKTGLRKCIMGNGVHWLCQNHYGQRKDLEDRIQLRDNEGNKMKLVFNVAQLCMFFSMFSVFRVCGFCFYLCIFIFLGNFAC